MNLLALYSKIQLKIGKAEEEQRAFAKLKANKRLFAFSLAAAQFKLQLLFYKTLKTIIRFFALLFNDSSDNFLMFASEMGYKAKRLHSPEVSGTMEPAITFVCNNSFCQYKRFQKRVRFYSKTAFAGVLICTIITSSILYFMMPGKPTSRAETYNWVQSNWGGDVNTTTFPNHTDNKTNWTDYYAKDANVLADASLTMSATSDSWTETTDADFDGTLTDVQASGDDLILLPLPTTTTTTFSAGDTDADEAGASNINFDTGSGVVKLSTNTQTLILRPNGAGDYTNVNSQYPASGAHWDKVDEATADDDTTYVVQNGEAGNDIYALENHTTETGEIQQVKIYFRAKATGEAVAPRFRLGTSEVNGTYKYPSIWTTYSEVLSRPDGGSWTWTDIDNLQAGAELVGAGGDTYLTQLYVEVTYVSSYVSPGAFTSTNLLSAQTVGPIDSFSYNLTALPVGTTAKVSFSQNNTTWFNSAGTADGWDTMSAGDNTISLTTLNWTGANFYYKMEWTSDGTDTPILDSVSVHTNYPSTGNLISSIEDTGQADPDFTTISWSETLNTYGDVDLKVRSSDNADMAGATAWGDIVVIESTGGDISGIGSGQYVQYQAILSTSDQTVTPQLHDITINWGVTATLTSSPYDTGDAANVLNQILWDETILADTEVKFQLRTSADNSTWSGWYGADEEDGYFTNSATGCSKAGQIVTCSISDALAIGDGASDQWIQYKTYLVATGANTPTLSGIDLQYVINGSPVVSNTAAIFTNIQVADSANEHYGKIAVSYDLSDPDSSSFNVSILADIGVTLNENPLNSDDVIITVSDASLFPDSGTIQIDNEQIRYYAKNGNNLEGTVEDSMVRGANTTKATTHSSGVEIWIKGTTTGSPPPVTGDVGSQAAGTGKSIVWNIKTDLPNVYYATAKIRVAANDGNAANQVGNGDSSAFVLDTLDPSYSSPPLIIDSNASGDSLTNITVTEDSTLSVRYANASNINGSTCAADIGSVAYESLVGSSKEWTLSPDANGVSTVCFQAKDNHNNETAVTFASTPQTPVNMQISDISAAPASKYKTLVWWDVVPDPGSFSRYNIYRSTNGTDYLPCATIEGEENRLINYCFDEGDGNCTDDSVGELVNTTTYYYKITAQDADGTSLYSSVVSAVPDGSTSGEVDATAPTLSSDPSASVSSSTATITWATNEGSYSLVRYGATISLGSVAGSATETVTSHSVDLAGLTPGVLYYYQILSADSSGNLLSSPASPPTGLHTFTTTADITAPSLVGSPVVTAGRTSATISWVTDEASDSQVKYIVAVDDTTDPAGGTATTLQTEKVTNHFVIITGLSSDETYNYQVISTDNYTNTLTSPSSAPYIQFTTSTDKADPDAPGITFNSVDDVTEGLTSAIIVWTTDENAYSVVEYGLDGDLGSVAGTVDNSTMNHSVTISNLSNSTAYYYKLRSADSSGNLATEPSSGTHTFTTTADAIDPVISSVTVASSDRSSAVITWDTDENASSQVEYGINADLSGSSSTTLQTEKVLNHITVLTGLTPDISYYYRVISADAADNSAQSSIGSFETISGAKPVVTFNEGAQGPSEANSFLGDHTASATFSASNNAFFSIVYEASETEPGSYTQEYGVPSLVTADQNSTISLVGLEENTKYYYKLRARDIYGNIGESSSAYSFTTTTDIIPPTITFNSSTDVTSITDSSAIISWTTNEAATSLVDYGTDTSYGSNETNANYNVDHSIALSSLLPATTYYFKLTSVDNSISENSTETIDYTFTTLASSDTTPPVISAVSSTGSGDPSYNTATISWTTDENANSLVDFGTTTSYGTTQGNSSDSTTSHSVVLSGLASSTTYYYKVKSMDVAGNIGFDADDSEGADYEFTTAAAPEGDTTPTITVGPSVTATTATTATIEWTTDESSDSTVGYSIGGTSYNMEQGSNASVTSHTVTLINLAPGTTYNYQVKSRNNAGNLVSGVGDPFTTSEGGDALAPDISGVTISDLTDHTAKITWTTNENSNSLIDYSQTSGIFTSTTGQYQDSAISHTVTMRGLDPSTAYYFQARSIDTSSNEGTDSNNGDGYTFTTTAGGDETPPEISNVAVVGTPTRNSATITWDTNELSNSLIDFGTSTSYGTTQGNSADSVTSHSVTLTGLSPLITYYYRVKSIDTSGNLVSDDNASDGYYSFTTAAGVSGDEIAPKITFNSVTGITNKTSNSVTIFWTTDEAADSTVGYSLDTSFNTEKGSAGLDTDHTVILTNLSSGTVYKFQIKSMDAAGNLTTENSGGDGYTFETLAGGDSTAPIITGVSSGTCTDTTCAIIWTTDENSSSLVDYGTVLGTYASTGGNYKASVTSHSVTLNGLTAETTYYYRVRSIDANDNQALDSGGTSGYSFTTTTAAESECPACPSCGGGGGCPSTDTNPPTISNVTVSAITTNSVVVKWETNEKSYSLTEYGLDDSYGNVNGSATASVKNHTVSLTKLDENTTHHYRVLSADSSGNLAQSEDFTFKTVTFGKLSPEDQKEQTQELNETTATEIQTKIEELLAQGIDEEEIRIIIARASEPPVISTEGPVVENVTNNSAKVIWITDRKSNSVIRFKAKEEGVDPETSSSLKQYGNFKELAVEHQVILASLNSGTSYQYQVQSSDVLGNTSKSDWNEFATEITPSIYDVVISEITLSSAVISWKTNVVTSSKVEYGETINYTNSAEDKDLTKVAKHSMKLNNLKSGTLYHFRVRGIGGEGSSLVSDDYTFTTFTLPQIETYQIEEIAERTIKLNWKTNVETDSTLKYTDLETNITKLQGEDGMSSIHNFTLKGLNPGVEYLLQIQGRDIYGNQAITSEFTATTLADNTPPKITQIRTETAVSSGKSDVVQTIISWKTNEPTTSQILWEEGISEDEEPKNSTPEDENYTTNHIMVITTFKPASVYRFRVQGKDKAGNIAQSQDFTILIPEKKKSVIQIIISNFEDTFGWVKKIGL